MTTKTNSVLNSTFSILIKLALLLGTSHSRSLLILETLPNLTGPGFLASCFVIAVTEINGYVLIRTID